jgi:hypothetical protein
MPDLRLDRESRLVVMEPLLGAPLFLACVGPPGLVIRLARCYLVDHLSVYFFSSRLCYLGRRQAKSLLNFGLYFKFVFFFS